MRSQLFSFQEAALSELHAKIKSAHADWHEGESQAICFSAPTGTGKTIIMTALFEEIWYGTGEAFEDPDAIFVWLSDSPELNEQTRRKIEAKADKIPVRNVVMVDGTYDREHFTRGKIYFLNTQKIGSDKLLTQHSDARTYTIWETLTNTAKRYPEHLYIIIDEAHRGSLTNGKASGVAKSIMQKFILGSPDDGLSILPLVIGMTATPQRFLALLERADKTVVRKVAVSPADVRDSGLLKDRVIIRYPDMAINADITMFSEAAKNWQEKCRQWENYCREENERPVRPVLVVQVEDASGKDITRTDIGSCIDALESVLGRKLKKGEVAHTFDSPKPLTVHGLDIPYVEPSRIEDDEDIGVVFFKMNLSTGWDCPRAETMMSFRSAQDFTYIAQLLGRMIRTPLARRIAARAELNDVSLYLPFYNENTVEAVIKALNENEAIAPTETGSNRELVTLKRNDSFADIFAAAEKLVTYRLDSVRKQPSIKLYVLLSKMLEIDRISHGTKEDALRTLIGTMDDHLEKLKECGEYERRVAKMTGFSVGAVTYEYGEQSFTVNPETQRMELSPFDIRHHFDQAGRLFGEGLHLEYWRKHSKADSSEIKLSIIVMANDTDLMEKLAKLSEDGFYKTYHKYSEAISNLQEHRRNFYDRLIGASAKPVPVPWKFPLSIDFNVSEGAEPYDKHLYLPEETSFTANLNPWENDVLREEMNNGAIAWLRNLDRKKWALAIPYEVNGSTLPMYPDLLIVRMGNHGYVFDILEPHDASRKDNYPKAVGLAKFAEEHAHIYGRIELIRKQKAPDGKEHFFRLNIANVLVRKKVKAIHSNQELDQIFEEYAERED